ncbi:Adenylate cyclase type 3 [Biomphalaria glabrata]|nr:adenylate cyclase type 3-like [Biomphalaria glabrata]
MWAGNGRDNQSEHYGSQIYVYFQVIYWLVHDLGTPRQKFHQVRIKILGDCYYCVCGALEPRMDHAVLSIHMGLSMVTAISTVRQSTGKDVNMRVGVHTGACLGGVLGQRQWQFDILGKEVTMANKMESGGLPGRVHISEATKQCLNGEFELEDGHGGDREEELKLKNITSYLVKSVIKPYPEGTLDKVTQSSPTKMISNGNKKNQVTDKKESSVEEDTTDSGHTISKEEEYRKELSLRLQHELLAKEKDSVLSGTLQPLTLTFKEKQLETRYHQRSDSYNGLPLMALSVALVVILGAKLCILPRSGLLIAIYLSGDIILFAMSAVSLSLTFRHYFPRSIIQFALTIDRHGTFKMLWGISACVIFFICDTLPSIDCHQVALNITMVTQCDMEALTCHHIVYFTHAASLVLIAISSMVNLGHMTKALLIYIATGIHCALVLLYVDVSYELYNEKIYQECSQSILVYPHIKYRLLGQMIAAAIDLNFFNFQMEFTSRKLFLWKEESKREKEKAADMQRKNEALVYNLLPAHVAKDFLGKKKNDLDLYSFSYDEVGVIFAACPNFHSFYNESSINNNGLECLRFLNEIISDYDELLNLARFSSIVKIKTVGPTYMAASGMVSQDDRKHVTSVKERWYHLHNLVQFAYALQDVLKKINEQSFNNFILRIGINHGPIIAGVIGARKPHYDIWGNTVNVASRMESTGQPGKIQVAEETKLLLENFGYKFETRGLVKVKGKGELMTYFLERPEGTNECDLNIPNSVPDG